MKDNMHVYVVRSLWRLSKNCVFLSINDNNDRFFEESWEKENAILTVKKINHKFSTVEAYRWSYPAILYGIHLTRIIEILPHTAQGHFIKSTAVAVLSNIQGMFWN